MALDNLISFGARYKIEDPRRLLIGRDMLVLFTAILLFMVYWAFEKRIEDAIKQKKDAFVGGLFPSSHPTNQGKIELACHAVDVMLDYSIMVAEWVVCTVLIFTWLLAITYVLFCSFGLAPGNWIGIFLAAGALALPFRQQG